MSLNDHITATRTSAWPFLLRLVVLRSATALAPLMLLWLAARRLAGNFAPLPGAALVLLGVMAVSAVIVWRHVWRSVEGGGKWFDACERYLPAVCLALLAVAFSIRGTHWLGLVLFWMMIVGEEVWYGWKRTGGRRESPHPGPLPQGEGEEEALLPPDVSQQMTRSVDASGETLECLLRVSFAVGEQTQTVHVAFCPPLLYSPTATIEHLDGAACDAKITATEVYGARLEVKRRGALALEDEAILLLRVVGRQES